MSGLTPQQSKLLLPLVRVLEAVLGRTQSALDWCRYRLQGLRLRAEQDFAESGSLSPGLALADAWRRGRWSPIEPPSQGAISNSIQHTDAAS